MIREAIIWRKSIYDNDFKCKCGQPLAEEGTPLDDVLYDAKEQLLFCHSCGWCVAKLRFADLPEDTDKLLGDWDEFLKKSGNGRS